MKSTQFATETDSVKVIFTGTGTSQGIPVIGCQCPVCTSADERDNRLRTSVYVELDNGYHLTIDSGPDFRQQIANGWPQSIDDSAARADWGWKHAYDVKKMSEAMLHNLKEKLQLV